MSIDYAKVLEELKEEEDRLTSELKVIRDAIPAMTLMAAKNLFSDSQRDLPLPTPIPIAPYAGMGPTEGIKKLLAAAEKPMTTGEITQTLIEGGLNANSGTNLSSTVSALLGQMRDKGTVEKVGEGWKRKSISRAILNPAHFSSTAQ